MDEYLNIKYMHRFAIFIDVCGNMFEKLFESIVSETVKKRDNLEVKKHWQKKMGKINVKLS